MRPWRDINAIEAAVTAPLQPREERLDVVVNDAHIGNRAERTGTDGAMVARLANA